MHVKCLCECVAVCVSDTSLKLNVITSLSVQHKVLFLNAIREETDRTRRKAFWEKDKECVSYLLIAFFFKTLFCSSCTLSSSITQFSESIKSAPNATCVAILRGKVH